ncbi:adrenodoxin, mitochondrial-like isoform X1 [Sceloporus undulatus]|uniref:adrenodoxin, mitochondrial-like isoform X1 n=1 Tax=Sceloporus undulatus TaxID=8520 RepID=UPI001C4B8E9F|nr:adrenodoxin, mitochondrial-like isoform X1 [Sceloporus undulatus]
MPGSMSPALASDLQCFQPTNHNFPPWDGHSLPPTGLPRPRAVLRAHSSHPAVLISPKPAASKSAVLEERGCLIALPGWSAWHPRCTEFKSSPPLGSITEYHPAFLRGEASAPPGRFKTSLETQNKVLLHFINRNGEKFSVAAKEGESLLEVVVNQNLSIDGFGACEGTLACSTCHLIFEEDTFRKLEAISDEELDMLDLAFGLTDTSRLGCQVSVKKWMDGLTVHVPREVSDIRKELDVEKQNKQ